MLARLMKAASPTHPPDPAGLCPLNSADRLNPSPRLAGGFFFLFLEQRWAGARKCRETGTSLRRHHNGVWPEKARCWSHII